MNDFDDIIGDAVGHRADNAPLDRPDFGDVLGARQQRLRRRSVVGALGVLAIGATGMAAFAVGGPTESTADGPDGSGGSFAPTTMPGQSIEATVPGEMVWYCRGALDQFTITPTTTITPATTIAEPVDSVLVPEDTYVPPLEDSGYFRDCVLIEVGGAVDEGVIVTTTTEQFPATTTSIIGSAPDDTSPVVPDDVAPAVTGSFAAQPYVVRSGDYAIKVADEFCVPLEDLLNFNGWDTGSEFPFPGNVINIPPAGCTESPSAPCTIPGCGDAAAIHTIQAGDYPIQVANDYCVSFDDLVTLNGWDFATEFGFPGERIQIPAPPTEGNCPDNSGN